jgi:N6-adenosine-specific RNA methylase IME4
MAKRVNLTPKTQPLVGIDENSKIYGKVQEGMYIAGFTFTHACQHLEKLLAGDDWMFGGRFTDVNDFLASIEPDEKLLTLAKDKRKKLAQRIKELQPKAENRKIAKLLGVDERTVRRDTAANAALDVKKDSKNNGEKSAAAAFAAAGDFSGEDTAKLLEKKLALEQKQADIKEARREFEGRRDKGSTIVHLDELIAAGKKFPVIYADPPWEFKVYSGKGKQRSAERHYDTMSLDAIKALPVEKLAEQNCALFIWGVWPELPGVLDVIKAWGFTYKTAGFIWIKTVSETNSDPFTGMGYWTRANSEFCLFAARGEPKRDAMDVHQVVLAPVGEHSVKPEDVRKRIERLIIGPYLELFGRQQVEGWVVWGNEIEVNKREAAE